MQETPLHLPTHKRKEKWRRRECSASGGASDCDPHILLV